MKTHTGERVRVKKNPRNLRMQKKLRLKLITEL